MTETAEIIRIAARGDGVTADGRHFALAAPGDSVAPDGTLIAGPHRAEPACIHFPECGGCQLQQLDEESFADFVADRVRNALSGQKIDDVEVRAPHLSAPNTRRRASLRAERRGKKVLIGFNAGQSHRIVDMKQCAILHPTLFALIEPLRALLGPMMREKRPASVKMTLSDQGVDLLLEGVEADGLAAAEGLSAFAENQALARLSLDDGFGPQTRWEPEPVTITLGKLAVPLPHDAFLQATADGEQALLDAVLEAIGDATMVADLFSGLGTFALGVVGGRKVYAAEAARDAGFALKSAADRVQLPVFMEHRDLYRRPLTIAELDRFGAVILDPPRAGAEMQIAAMAAAKTPRIAYVSCNPATFARDAKTLIEGGYRLDWVQPVGQFRWSTHVELAAAFSR